LICVCEKTEIGIAKIANTVNQLSRRLVLFEYFVIIVVLRIVVNETFSSKRESSCPEKESGPFEVTALEKFPPSSSPEFIFVTALAPLGEESLWHGSGLMSCWKDAFACSMLPKRCNPKTDTEPKRNVLCVPQHDFSSKILHLDY
jgi:hypothetical protein